MAARIPLVLVAGDIQQLNLQDTLANNLGQGTTQLLIALLAEARLANILKAQELDLSVRDIEELAEAYMAEAADLKG